MNNSAVALGVLCGLVVAIPFALWLGAVLLRTAVSLANLMIGRPRVVLDDLYDDPYGLVPRTGRHPGPAIPEPATSRAMVIVLVTGFAEWMVGFTIGVVMAIGSGGRMDPETAAVMTQLIALPVGFVVQAGMLASLLPTTFGRACLVAVCEYLILIAIGAVVVGMVIAAGIGQAFLR